MRVSGLSAAQPGESANKPRASPTSGRHEPPPIVTPGLRPARSPGDAAEPVDVAEAHAAALCRPISAAALNSP
jgi:hypothetical protein